MNNILLLGSGGREHAILKALKKSNKINDIYAFPGNAGILNEAFETNITKDNFESIYHFCAHNNIDYVFVGGETELVLGITDYLENKGLKVFGPDKKAAQIEGSKQFMKNIAKKYNAPTAKFENFDDEEKAISYLQEDHISYPLVIKTDGLAAGKGVLIVGSEEEATDAIKSMFAGKFAESGKKIIIEEFLQGIERSFFVLCNGKASEAKFLGVAKDYKRAFDGDKGLNTGGMGTYSDKSLYDEDLKQEVMEKIIFPYLKGLESENIYFKGVLFAGLMLTKEGAKLIEFNIRFGDPEAQVLIPKIKNDFFDLIECTCNGKNINIEIDEDLSTLCVVMASKGYPEAYQKGSVIENLDEIENMDDVILYHAGTKKSGEKI